MNTIRRALTIKGHGYFTNEDTHIELKPYHKFLIRFNDGFEFSPTLNDMKVGKHTTYIERNEHRLLMVEHLFGVLYMYNISGLIVEVKKGNEIPMFDGSGKRFLSLKPIKIQAKRPSFTPLFPVFSERIAVFPSHNLRLVYFFYNTAFPIVAYTKNNMFDLANARTFSLKEENGLLKKRGKFYIFVPQRMSREIVFHKMFDFLGDMYLLPFTLKGVVFLMGSGHRHNHKFAKILRRFYYEHR